MANRFMDLLGEHGIIVFDGAVGTMLFEHGVFINRSFDQLNLTSPDLVRDIHTRYLAAGAMAIETNTFGANRFKLSPFDLQREVAEINRRGALIAREAAGENGFVAGSVGPLGVRIEPWGPTSLDEARAAFREQIDALLGAGVDAIVLETFTDLAEMRQALEAFGESRALLKVDVPVIGSMTVDREGNSLYGTEPENFGPKLESWGADIVGLNCSVGPRPMLETLEKLRAVTTRPLSVMPNAGLPTEVDGRTIYICSPDYMANYARRFVQVGARIVGGCCGTTPDHIRAIAASIRQISGESRSMVARAATAARHDSVPPQTVALSDRSRLAAKVSKGEFVASVELAPPQGWDLDRILKSAAAVRDAGFDAVNIPDGPRASARMGSLAMATLVERSVGIETIMHYACRDRNLVGMQSDLLGAYALGLRNLLIITGDPPILGDYPQATAVFDVDSIGLTNMVHRLNTGLDLGGRSIGKPTGFLIAVGLNPTALSPDKELSRFHWKVDAGAELAITQPVFDPEQLLAFLDRIDGPDRIPILAGIWPLQSLRNAEFLANEVPGVSVPRSVLDRMAAARSSETEAEEGERIAIEIMEKVSGSVLGIQVAAPFGRIHSAVNVLGAARRIFGAKAKKNGNA
ncbi:MAG: bifunctional homocysteine S-methyltransferase/methylenetetrahydrofolate reductase [Deltaproteobacteria bacterium]|nr:bifunctional homocysteine S-methyltransferase/methylenetetrahydrofolate reductase [Deltaproteobacteria bacterium]